MNRLHLARDAVTVYEALEDAGLTTAAINITCYRGRTRHLPTLPGGDDSGVRAEAVLLLQPVRVRPDRGAAGGVRSGAGIDRRLRGRRRALARDARRLRLPRLLPAGLRLRIARTRSRTMRSRRLRAATLRSARCWTPPEGRTSSSSVTRSCSVPITGRPTSSARRGWRVRSRTFQARSSPRRTAPGWCIACLSASSTRVALAPFGSTTRRPPRPCCSAKETDVIARRDGEEMRVDPTAARCATTRTRAARRAWAALHNPNAGDVVVSAPPGCRVRRPRRPAPRRAAGATARCSPAIRRCRC